MAQLKTAIQANKLAQMADAEFRTGEVSQVTKIAAMLDQRDLDKAVLAAAKP